MTDLAPDSVHIPPEVVAGQPATLRSDLYACGVVLRERLEVSPSRSLRKVADQLAADDPGLRPGSAADAIAMLERLPAEVASSTAETASLRMGSAGAGAASAPSRSEQARSTPRLSRPRMTDFRRAFVVATAVIAAGIVLVAILVNGGDSANSGRERPLQQPARNVPLDEQLDALERAVREAARR